MQFGKRQEAEISGNVLDESSLAQQAAEMPGKPFQSVLYPHLEAIKNLRRHRKTWDEIAATLNAAYDIHTSGPSVYKFAKRRAARPGAFGFAEEGTDNSLLPSHPVESPVAGRERKDASPSPTRPETPLATDSQEQPGEAAGPVDLSTLPRTDPRRWDGFAKLKGGLPPS